MWRSVGFLMSFAVVIEGMTIAAFVILLAGGKQRREAGWGALTVLTLISAVVQAISMALMVGCIFSSTRPTLTLLDLPV
jgi:formate hydrogenlyase subunit 3/multisubunit Na+/H+ antiporter MnhD subunit